MKILERALAEIYRAYNDDYLLEKYRSGTLTALGEKVVSQELLNRNICPLPPWPVNPAVKADQSAPLRFVTVASSFNSIAMHILCARLEAEGIPAYVADSHMAQAYSTVSIAVGGARLQVVQEYRDDALELIAAINSGALTARDSDDSS